MKTDIQIAQEAKMEHIKDVAARAGIEENELEFYGKYKAKLSDELRIYPENPRRRRRSARCARDVFRAA